MIVCLSGFKYSGKDSLASYLIEKYGAKRVSLADPLKDSVAQEFGIDRASLDDPERKEQPILHMPVTPKDGFSENISQFMIGEFRTADGQKYQQKGLLQIFSRFNGVLVTPEEQLYWTPRALAILKGSTNRSVTSNYWTNKAFEAIDLAKKDGKIVVVSDVRYKSEVAQFKERFGRQAVFVRINRHKESPSQDPSERDLDGHEFDFYVDNTGTLEQTYAQMESILESV
jgi:hypothetical protein